MQSPLTRRSAPPAPSPKARAADRPRRGLTRTLAAGTAAAALVLTAAGGATAEDGGGAGPGFGPGPDRGIALSPGYGGEGTAVDVRAVCTSGGRGGIVSSPAFERTVGLERAEAEPRRESHAVATVRPGLDVGRSYPVVAVCGTGELLSTSFVHTGVTAPAPASVRAGAVDLPSAPAVGGGVALVGLVGGLLVLRRAGRRRERERLAAWVRRARDAEAEQDATRGSTRM